jgi:hypothetical protein
LLYGNLTSVGSSDIEKLHEHFRPTDLQMPSIQEAIFGVLGGPREGDLVLADGDSDLLAFSERGVDLESDGPFAVDGELSCCYSLVLAELELGIVNATRH